MRSFYLTALCVLVLAVAPIRQPSLNVHATEKSTSHDANLEHPDLVCAGCHRDIYERYETTPMAQGSGIAKDGFIAGQFDHAPSGIHYSVSQRAEAVWLTYSRGATAEQSEPLKGEQELKYFIGSGHRGRTYLFSQQGLWFEAPINYYSKKQIWDMAPNYGSVRTLPLTLPVDSNCLHCHVGEVSAGDVDVRNRFSGAPFRAGGIGCAACHGDPSSHLTAEQSGNGTGKIVNPAKLGIAERDSTCLQCHLEGDASIYKVNKSLASYQAGEDLAKYVTYFVDSARPGFGGRASSQYEALLRSACKRAAGDKLTCTTCHDPHSSPSAEERVSYFRGKCLACHTGETIATQHHPEQQDCAVCHMLTRKSLDISHEQLTDHDIESKPGKRNYASVGLTLQDLNDVSRSPSPQLEPVGQLNAGDRELGLAYAQFARKGNRKAGGDASRLLARVEDAGNADVEVHVQLGFLKHIGGDLKQAEIEYREALRADSGNETALANLAVLEASTSRSADAAELLRRVIEEDPSQTAAGLNLAFIECRTGLKTQAAETLEIIRVFNPDSPALRNFLARGEYGGQRCELNR